MQFFLRLLMGLLWCFMSSAAIIGEDDRKDWNEIRSTALRNYARSVVAIFDEAMLTRTRSGYRLSSEVRAYEDEYELCPGVRFSNQPSAAFCTGFLVTSHRVVTAAHCFEENVVLSKLRFVFDFKKATAQQRPFYFSRTQVFHARRVTTYVHNRMGDWAVIELTRAVRGRPPLRLRSHGEPAPNTPVVLLGHPHGLPLKIADNARVARENETSDSEFFFEAPLDNFKGNSGGPVLNARTLEVEGMLTTGFGEWENPLQHPVTGKKCYVPRNFRKPSEITMPWVQRTSKFRADVLAPNR